MAENNEPVHVRELMTLLEGIRKDIKADIQIVNTNLEKRIEQVDQEMDKRFDVHEIKHEREKDHRSSLTRWAVTTILMFTGLGISAYSVMEAIGG